MSAAKSPAEMLDSVDLALSTYRRAAYLALRDMIVELELPPGTRLVEKDLATRLNISKTPIREAIASLEGDGLVDFAPYRRRDGSLALDERDVRAAVSDRRHRVASSRVGRRTDYKGRTGQPRRRSCGR